MRALAACALIGVALIGCAEGGGADSTTTPAVDGATVSDGSVVETSAPETSPIFETGSDEDAGPVTDTSLPPPDTKPPTTDTGACVPGTSVPCTTSCATAGTSTCVGGAWSKCAAKSGDPCLGLDCKGIGDGLEHTYYKDGDGDGHGDKATAVQGCAAPAGHVTVGDDCNDANKDVFPGATEVCDKVDNNCNGEIDEGVHVLTVDLAFSAVPPCNTADMASCKAGAHAWCRAKSSCYDGGFGPVELGPSNGIFVCISGGTITSGWPEANTAQPACSSDALAPRRVCESAVHRAGGAKGFESAVLQTHAPGDWKILGLPAARAQGFHGLVWSDLTSRHAGCKSGSEDSWDCNAASHRFCRDKGFASGFGPVEYNPTNVSVVCVKS